MEWINGFFIPVIEVAFIGGILLFFLYMIVKAILNAWSKSAKFFIKYKLKRKKYPEETLAWCIDCIEKDMNYYDVKKKLLLAGTLTSKQINEILWIYKQTFNQLNREKGGNKHGRKSKGCYSQTETAKLPTI